MDWSHPLITLNLFFTPIIVSLSTGIILLIINRMFNKRDKKDEEIAKHLVEIKSLKEKNLSDWQDTYSKTQCSIKNTVEEIEKGMNGKVDKTDCIRETRDKWDAISDLRKRMNEARI
jgi:hypothetical protein